MAEAVYILCALASLACAILLLRGYRKTAARHLLWSGLCFAGLAANNILLFVDKVIFPTDINLSVWRSAVALVALSVLLYGLVWDTSLRSEPR
jgi:hypothetical protein